MQEERHSKYASNNCCQHFSQRVLRENTEYLMQDSEMYPEIYIYIYIKKSTNHTSLIVVNSGSTVPW